LLILPLLLLSEQRYCDAVHRTARCHTVMLCVSAEPLISRIDCTAHYSGQRR